MAEKFWSRRHGNGWRGIVKQVENGTYWSGFTPQKGFPTLDQAQARSDADVEQNVPHRCEDSKCDPWPDHPSKLMD